MSVAELLDLIVVATLLWIAWRAVSEPALFTAAVLFIVFGLVMAIAWVRLAAPDVAIAEVAIGAGITGALLLDAVAHVESRGLRSSGDGESGESGASGESVATDEPAEMRGPGDAGIREEP
jgi:energy-converting hydrogenase B subunit D